MTTKNRSRSRRMAKPRPSGGLHAVKHKQPATTAMLIEQELTFASPVDVSPTDLRLLELCPLQLWHACQLPFETAAPSLGLALGQVVHAARQSLSTSQRRRYISAKSDSDFWSQPVENSLRAEIDNSFDRHYYLRVFGGLAERARSEWTGRLLTLEQARAEAAVRAWSAGLREIALADTCTPERTETEWFDLTLRMHGFCDELWNDGGTARLVELKTSPPSPRHRAANRYQVAAYAFLARQVEGLRVGPCEVEYLRDGTRDRFTFGVNWERRIREGIERVSEISRSQVPPAGSPSEDACGWCPFQHTCPESLAPSLDDAFAMLRVFDDIGERGDVDNH